jgi:hypothetical protein
VACRSQIVSMSPPLQSGLRSSFVDVSDRAPTRQEGDFTVVFSLRQDQELFEPCWKIHAFIFRWDRQKMAGIVDHGALILESVYLTDFGWKLESKYGKSIG